MIFRGSSKTGKTGRRKLARGKARESGRARAGELWSFRTSSIAWGGLAVVAVAYLASLLHDDGLTASREPASKTVTDRLVAINTRAPRVSATPVAPSDESALRASLIKLSAEISTLRTAVNALRRREDALESRLASLESAVGPATSALVVGSQLGRAAPGVPKRKPALGNQPVKVTMGPLPKDGFGDSSMNKSPVPIADVEAPTRTLFGAELAVARTTEALRTHLQSLSAEHPRILAGLEARRAKPVPGSGAGGKDRQRLIVGPFRNAADAARLCVRLRAVKASCEVTVFAGEPL